MSVVRQAHQPWKECKLGNLTWKITKGTTPPNGHGFVSNGINYIKSESIGSDGRIDKSKFAHIDEETHYKLKRSWLQENDILFSMAGVYLGKSALVTNDMLPANTNQALAIIRINQEFALPRYVNYYLMQKSIVEYVNNMSGQSAQPNVNFQEIASIAIPIPTLPEQRAIAGVLSSLDDKIDLLHRQNKTLEGMAEALWRKMFVEEADPRWKKEKLGDIVKIIYGKNLPTSELTESGYPVFGANGQIGYYKEYLYASPQVLISCRGEASGKVNFSCGFAFVTNNSLVLEIPINSILKYEFLKYWALASDFTLYVTGSAQPQITIEELKMAEFDMPSEEAISHFSAIVATYEGKRSHNNKQIAKLVRLRDTLLPKLMSGEVRVKI
jgi:type I restriction enzyme, S subunit